MGFTATRTYLTLGMGTKEHTKCVHQREVMHMYERKRIVVGIIAGTSGDWREQAGCFSPT